MKSLKISVIVPVYNVEQYLSRCMNSIINQSYSDIEIILIDDGSTDSSGQICDDYARSDNRIKVIHKKNGGLSDARNVGLDVACGEFIAFVDSDDFIHKDMFNILLNKMNKYECDIVESGFIKVYENQKINEEEFINDKESIYNREEAMVSTIMDHHCRNFVVNKLYKRKLWDGIRFPYGEFFEDVSTTYKVINKCSKLIKIEQPLYYYIQRYGSITNSDFSIKKLNDHIKALDEMMEFIEIEQPNFIPITSIKYFSTIIYYLQELIIYRKKVERSNIIIKKISEGLVRSRYRNYLSFNTDEICKELFNGEGLLITSKEILSIRFRLKTLEKSYWFFYISNNISRYLHYCKKTYLDIKNIIRNSVKNKVIRGI